MAGEDFFLKFGSNSDEFARNVRDDVSQARRQIELLTKAVRELEGATRGSSAATNLISGLREDLRTMSTGLARDLGRQLRVALQRELSGLNINVGATVEGAEGRPSRGGRTDRPSAADTPEADRLAAQAARQAASSVDNLRGRLDRLASAMGEQETKLRGNFERMSEQQQRAMARMFAVMERFQGRINALRAEPAPGVDTGLEAQELARLSADISRAIQNSLRTGVLQMSRELQARIAAATGEAAPGPAAERRGPASATAREEQGRVEIDPAVVRAMIDAGAQQLRAAEELTQGANRFGVQVDRFAAAVANMRIAAAPTGIDAATAERQQQAAAERVAQTVAEQTQTAARAQTQQPQQQALTSEDLSERLGRAVAQVQQISKRFPGRNEAEILESPQAAKLREAFGGDEDAVRRVVREFINNTDGAASAVSAVRQEMEILRLSAEQAQATTQEVARTNTQSAQARREETATARSVVAATDEVARAERNVANARDSEARAANQAARETAGTPARPAPASTEQRNRELNQQLQRQQALQAVLTGEGATGAFRIDEERRPRAQREEAAGEARARREAAGLGTLNRQQLFEEAFERIVPSNIEGEARQRLRGVFLGVSDDVIREARRTLNQVSSAGVPAVSQGAMTAMFTAFAETPSADVSDPAFQRQRRRSRALELLPALETGAGSIEAATRGGALDTLNERLRQVGFEGEVGSRAEGREVLSRLRTDLSNIIGGMTGADREDFRRLTELPEGERAVAAQRLRTAADELAQAGRLVQAAIRTGSIQPPTGTARAPDILERTEGEIGTPAGLADATRRQAELQGRQAELLAEREGIAQQRGEAAFSSTAEELTTFDARLSEVDAQLATLGRRLAAVNTQIAAGGLPADPRRRQIAEATDVVRMGEARNVIEAGAVAQQFSAMGASLAEIEGLTTETAQQGQVKRLALEALEANDQAIVDRYSDIVPDDEGLRRQVEAAQGRVAERTARDIEDQAILERKLEASAARGEGAAARTEAVRRGGLTSLSRMIEIPEEALRAGAGGGRGMRFIPSPERTVGRQEALAETFGRGHPLVRNLTDMFTQVSGQAVELNRQRLLRGEAQSALTSAQAFREQGVPVDERQVQAAERIMARTENVERDLQNTLRQLFVPGAATGVEQQRAALAEAEAGGDPAAIARAQQRFAESMDLERIMGGRSLSDVFYDPTRPAEEAAGGDPRIARVMQARMDAQAQALEAGVENVSEVVRRAGNLAARAFDEEQAQATSAARVREGFEEQRRATAEAATAFLRGGDPEAAAAEAERRRASVEAAERRAAPFVGREDDIRAAARGVATPEQLSSLVESLGGFERAVSRIAQQRGAGPIRTEEQIAGGLKPELREAPERLEAAQANLVERRNQVARQRLAVEEAQLDFQTSTKEEEQRAARARLTSEQRHLRSLEGAESVVEQQIATEQDLVRQRNEAIERGREQSANAERVQGQVRQELEGALRSGTQMGDAAEDMVSVYRGMAEPLDPSRVAAEGARFTTDRDYALRNTQAGGPHPFLYETQIPRSQLMQSPFAEQLGAQGPGGATLSAEQASQARLVQGPVVDQLRAIATRTSESEMPQAMAELRAVLRRIAMAGGVSPEEAERVTSVEQLVARIQQLAGSVEENTGAVQGNTSAEQQNTAATQQEATAQGGRRARPTFDLPGTEEGVLQTRAWLTGDATKAPMAGFHRSLENLMTRAREFEGAEPTRASSAVRNQLAMLAGRGFEQYGREAQATTTGRARIDDSLIRGAEAGVQQTLAAIGQMDLGEAERRVAERDTPAQIASVLTKLEATMSELIICCKAMQRMARGGGMGGGEADPRAAERLAIQRASGPQVARMITGELNRSVVEAIGRSEVARRQGDIPGSRRALSEAAMEVMAHPELGGALGSGQIVEGVRHLADSMNEMAQVTGAEPYRLGREDVDAIRADVNAAQRVRGLGDQETFRRFQAGDVEGTAQAMVQATGDVDGSMRELVQIFSLDAQAAENLRARLAALQQQLVSTGQSAQQRAADEAIANEPLRSRMIREDIGRRLAPESFDINAPVGQNAPLVAGEMARRDPSMEMNRILSNLKAVFGQLDDATLRLVQSKVQEAQASERARLADEAEAAASRRVEGISNLLPAGERARFQESIGAGAAATITPQEVTTRIAGATGGQLKASNTVTKSIQRMFDGADLDGRATAAVDQYVEAAQSTLVQYRTPFQQFLGELWGGRGFASSVVRTAGNFVSRYVGGALVFGLASKFRELTSAALETEQTFIRITSALDATGRSAEGVRSGLQDIAVETNTNIADTYEVMAQLVGVFETTEEALQATRVIGQLELISQGALSAREGFRALSAVVSTWQETLIEERGLDQTGAITYVADLATRIQDLTGVNIEDTTEGLARLGETAKALGIEMELIATAVGITAKTSGQTGQAASEQIGRILANFQNAGTTDVLVGMGITEAATVRAGDFNQVLTDLFENYSTLNSAQQRQVANLIGDPRQFALTNALLSNGAEALEVYEQSLNSSGAAAERQEEILGTLRGQIGQLGKQVQVLVQNLIDLGILNVFGALVKAASLFLGPLNNILDVLNNIKDASPFTRMIVDIGLTIAGFKVLMGLMGGALSQMTRMAGLGEMTGGIRGALATGRAMFRPQAGAAGTLDPAMVAAQSRRATLAPDPATLISPGGAPTATRRSARIFARELADSGRTRLRTALDSERVSRVRSVGARGVRGFNAASGGLGRFVTSMGFATLGLSLLVNALQKGTQELHDFANSVAERRDTEKEEREKTGESEEQTQRRQLAERLDESRNLGFFDRLGESSRHLFSSPGNFLKRMAVPGINLIPGVDFGGAQASLAGELPTDLQDRLTGQFTDILNVRDSGGTVEEAGAIRDKILEDYQEVVDSLPTASQKLEAERQLEGQLDLLDKITDNIIAANSGIAGAADFTAAQIEALLQSYSFVTSLDSAALGRYGEAISAIIGSSQSNLPEEAKAALAGVTGAGSFTGRLDAQSEALELAYDQALLELEQAEGEGNAEKIDAATQALQQIVTTRAQLDQEIIDAALSLPQQFADLALRTGDYEGAQRQLSSALQEARRQANEAAAGSPEQAAAMEAQLDILRKSAEASIAQELAALEMASIGERDPLAVMANDLSIAQLRLQSALDSPAGTYTPEEIRGFMQEIAQLQEQAADEQRAIADAMTSLAVEQTRNPLRQAHLEHSAALDAYNQALSLGLGAQEIIGRAQDVEATATAVRERTEELRVATAEAQIAALPQGDEVAIVMAELREAYAAQANIIREFGRDSAEFQDSLADIIDARRSVEESVNAVFEATTDLAVALAEAAGLDIEAGRVQLDAAVSNLQRAVDEAGGNMDAASVRQAMAEAASAQANLRDTVLGEALDTISFLQDMGDITSQQAIGALQEILNTMDLTEDQRRDILRQIKGLEESIDEAFSGGFNIADIRLPTPYEVRRSLGIDRITEGVEGAYKELQGAFDAANPRSRGGGSSALDDVLGGDLADEVRSVGNGVGDLLPPIKDIPRIVDETIASRDAVVASLRSTLEATMSVREAQNASITQLGAVISVPAGLTAQATQQTRDLTAAGNEMIAAGNEYLGNMSEQSNNVVELLQNLPAGISQTLIAGLKAEQANREPPKTYQDVDPRYSPGGPPSYGIDPWTGTNIPRAMGGPVAAYQAYKVGEYGEELFVPNTSGYIVSAADFAPVRHTPNGGGGNNVSNDFRISVAVHAKTNSDPDQIARAVSKEVTREISRQSAKAVQSSQSTPRMWRMGGVRS